jgi:hypothetical protein
MTPRKDLLALFDKMEKERIELLRSLESHSEELLLKKPSPDRWSITEVILHLSKAEEGALKYMKIKLEHGGHQKASLGSWLKQKLLSFAISLPIKYKAPNVIKLDETDTGTFSEAVANWVDIRMSLRKEYEMIDEDIIDHELFKHPAAGKLSVIQSVKFMRRHVQRHKEQIERTVKQAG